MTLSFNWVMAAMFILAFFSMGSMAQADAPHSRVERDLPARSARAVPAAKAKKRAAVLHPSVADGDSVIDILGKKVEIQDPHPIVAGQTGTL